MLSYGIWHWADSADTWFAFDPASGENPSATRASLQTGNWMNGKSDGSNLFCKICEMSKYRRMWK